MAKTTKRTNTMYFTPNDPIEFVELPEGYFYKNKFYTETQCFTALLKDEEVRIHSFPNGTWRYQDILYSSLKEIYESYEDEIGMSYEQLKHHYQQYGIEHDCINRTMYAYERDEDNKLYESRGELLLEIRNETNLIEDTEDRESRYLDNKTKEECIAYFKLPITKRIKLLEEFKQ